MSQIKRLLVYQSRRDSINSPKRAKIQKSPLQEQREEGEALDVGGGGGLQQFSASGEMSLQCTECQGNIADSKAGDKLAFCVDGTSVHLVMGASNEGRPGIGFRVEPVSADKRPTEKNPYRSVSHVLCANTRQDNGQVCRKKVGGVKCYPPLSDNQLIFFSHKALLVDHHRHKSWKDAREGTLRKVLLLPAGKEEEERQFQPRQWPPLVKTVRHDDQDAAVAAVTATAGMMRTPPRAYQEELFSAVMECEQNSLVYLPTGLGKTLVASMVLRRLLDLNPDRQAFFLVETTALAMQQTTRLQYEVGGMVEMLVGSSLAMYGSSGTRDGVDRGKEKLERLRAASIVVATAGAFEHCMCKHYIDPDSISCVVLDEAHHCGKEHPFNRVARSFLTMKAFPNVSPTRERDRELPKLVALTASPAGELTVFDTTVRINELLERLEAKLVAPVKHLGEVKRLTPTVNLELVNVTATSAETALLACLEKLVLSRVARIAPKASEVHAQARSLLDSLHSRTRDAYAAVEATAASGVDVPRKDDSWRFPNKFFTALCQRALASRNYAGGGGGAEQSGYLDWEADGAGMTMGDKEGDPLQLYKLMNASFAVDEVGGRPTWEKVLEELEKWGRGRGLSSSGGGRNGAGGSADDPELEETIRLLRSHLPAGGAAPDGGSGAAAAAAAEGVDGVGGSKLAKMVSLLEEHKRSCDESEKRFSALVFVSRRDLAQVTPAMLEVAAPFVRAQCVVGLAEMTLNQQRVALGSFRDGVKNVLVSTSVCGEGIDVPACALVVCASLPNSGTELVQLRGRIRSKEKGCRFVGLTRTSGAADQTHLKSICLREQNMLEAIRCLSSGDTSLGRAGDGKITGDDMARAGNSRATTAATSGILEPPIGSSAASRESAGTPTVAWSGCAAAGGGNGKSKSKSRSRTSNNTPLSPKSDITAETYNISESSSFTASSTVSSFGGHAARTLEKPATPGAAETTPTSPGYIASVQGSKAVDPPSGFEGSSKATQLLPSARPTGGEGGGKGSSAPVQVSLATGLAVKKVKSGKVNGVAFAPKAAAEDGQEGEEEEQEEEERNPWNKALPKMLTSAARRYAATYLATCVRQALQRNPDQMARCTLNSAAQLAQTIKPVFEYDERRVPGPPNASIFEARCIVRSNLAELEGLILVKEARGSSIKAAREGAAVKVKIYLLSKENSKVQPLGSCP